MLKNRFSPFCCLAFILALSACQPTPDADFQQVWPSGTVQHLVFCWLKEPEDVGGKERLIAASYRFLDIPGVLHVSAGPPLPSDREVVDSSYDVGILITLRDEQALEQYLPHPLHRKAVEEIVAPYVDRFLVYDFVVRKPQ